MEEQEQFREAKSALLEDLVRRRWVYENGTILNIQEARRGVLSGVISFKGAEKSLHFRGYYESTRHGPNLTIPNLPAFILDPIVDVSSFSSGDDQLIDREGPQIELQGSFGLGDELTLSTNVSFTQLSRRGRSRSHNPSNNTRGGDFSPSFSEPSIGPASMKHRPRCFSKDMVVQQAPTKTITWSVADEVSPLHNSPSSTITAADSLDQPALDVSASSAELTLVPQSCIS